MKMKLACLMIAISRIHTLCTVSFLGKICTLYREYNSSSKCTHTYTRSPFSLSLFRLSLSHADVMLVYARANTYAIV